MDKIAVGLSGGVDSSLVAYLLKKQGYEVVGVTMRTWTKDGRIPEYVQDAERVAQYLDIPFYVADFTKVFKEKVVDYFAEEYINGRTPNPCNACNRFVKWEALLEYAHKLGADKIATGHYANVISLENGRMSVLQSPSEKDQTYALCRLTQQQLASTIMPLGQYSCKEEVRRIAMEAGIPVAEKPDSQDICFIPDGDYVSLVKSVKGTDASLPGQFVDKSGKFLGNHKGIINYTIGQRKGLEIAMGHPVYVTGLDKETNRVIIGESEDLFSQEVIIGDINYMGIGPETCEFEGVAKIRYAHKGDWCKVRVEGGTASVIFDKPQRAVTPGQHLVIYDNTPRGRIILASGTIL